MGTEEFWIPAAVAALGAGVQQVDAHHTAQQQDEQAAQGIRIQSQDQQKADSQVGQAIQKDQQSNPETARANATNAFINQLRANKANAIGGGTAPGAVSSRYTGDTNTAAQTVKDYGTNAATTQAGIMAPELQRQAEGQTSAQLASNLGEVGRQSQADAFLSNLRLRGVQNNPWMQAGGSILQGIGNGMASSGTYGTTKTPKSTGAGSGVIPNG